MVLTGKDKAGIWGGLKSEEFQADDAMRRFSLLPWWKAGGRCRSHDVGVVGTAKSLLHFVLVGVEVETSKTLPSKYC